MEEHRRKETSATLKSRKCATKRFGIRLALVPFGYDGNDLFVPYTRGSRQAAWKLISDIPHLDESLDATAQRLYNKFLPRQKQSSIHQIHTFGDTNYRRTRWITVLYSTMVNLKNQNEQKTDIEWMPLDRRPLLTRLEDLMIDTALESLQKRVRYEPVGIYMLPPEFTLQQLQRMYELLLGQPVSKQVFRKKMWESEILIPLEETVTAPGRSQPKGLYRFNKKKYYELKRKGFFLDL